MKSKSMLEFLRYRIGTLIERFCSDKTNEHIFALSKAPCTTCNRKTHWIHADFAVRLHPRPRACTMIHWHRFVGASVYGYYYPKRFGPYL